MSGVAVELPSYLSDADELFERSSEAIVDNRSLSLLAEKVGAARRAP